MKIIKENNLFIHVSHPWPFPTSNGKKVIVHATLKTTKKKGTKKAKKKTQSHPRAWVPALL